MQQLRFIIPCNIQYNPWCPVVLSKLSEKQKRLGKDNLLRAVRLTRQWILNGFSIGVFYTAEVSQRARWGKQRKGDRLKLQNRWTGNLRSLSFHPTLYSWWPTCTPERAAPPDVKFCNSKNKTYLVYHCNPSTCHRFWHIEVLSKHF